MTTTKRSAKVSDWIVDPEQWYGHQSDIDRLGIAVREVARESVERFATRRCGYDRTPPRRVWMSTEIDVRIECAHCGDYALIGSTTRQAPGCSCEALAVADAERGSARLAALADTRAARRGRCCIEGCRAPGSHWYRTSTIAGARAVRSCDRHEVLAEELLRRLTMVDAIRLATPTQRRRAVAIAAEQDAVAAAAYRRSARLRGASSMTHAMALMGGAAEAEAAAQRAFASALKEARS